MNFWPGVDGAGEIVVHCMQVVGADSYNVYNDLGNGSFTLLGNVPDHTENTLSSITASAYRVRMAAVDGGVIGVMGNMNAVVVT